jgi:hypothetical protein
LAKCKTAVFGGCPNGNNGDDVYTVTIGTLTNGSITANPTSGIGGTEITLTVNPDDVYRLKTGTLKYGSKTIDESTFKFYLPAENVTVTAEFESKFIGIWSSSTNQIRTYTRDLIIIQNNPPLYTMKGTWIVTDSNTITHTITHQGSAETVEELLHPQSIDESSVSRIMGLKNVIQRLYFFYPDDPDVVDIETGQQGTAVIIRIDTEREPCLAF